MKAWEWVKRNRFFTVLAVIFILILARVHYNWIATASPLVSSDWPYFYSDLMKSWAPFHGFWINYDGLGRSIVQGNFVFLFGLYGFMANLGLGFEIISRLLFFLPVLILAPLGTFLAVNKVVKNRIAALTGAFIYSLNSYFIVIQGGHMHLSVTYALAPLVYYFAMKGTKLSYIAMFSLMCIIGIYDIRMSLVILAFAAIIAFFFNVKNKYDFLHYIAVMAMGTFAFILFSSFWILPMVFTQVSPFATNAFQQDALNWVTQIDALTLHHPFWSGSGVSDFVFQPASIYMMLLPAFVLLPLVFKKFPHRKHLLFFGSIFLIGSILLMQENSPLRSLYKLVYENIPLMSMFRESTKLFFVTAFCYSVLMGILISGLFHSKKQAYHTAARSLCILTLMVMAITVAPYLKGNYVKAYGKDTPSEEISEINTIVNPDNSDTYRNLWVSRVPKFAHIRPNKVNMDALTLSSVWGKYADEFDSMGYLKEQNIIGFLEFASVKYVIVPSDSIDINYHHYGEYDATHYKNIVSKWGLKKVYEKDGNVVWQNPSYKPRFYFSTDTIQTNALSDYSGIHTASTSAYVFYDQNKKLIKKDLPEGVISNEELQPFAAKNIHIEPGLIVSDLKIPNNKKSYDLYSHPIGTNQYTASPYNGDPLTISDARISGTNIYANGSFETNEPYTLIDANNHNKTSMDANGIKAIKVDDSTDGKYALKISARQHIADLTQKIKGFNKDSYYVLSFDYKYLAGPAPLVGLYPYKTEPQKRLLPLSTTSKNKWNDYHAIIKPGDYDKGDVYLLFYLPTKVGQKFDSSFLLDNVQLYEIPFAPKQYLQTTNQSEDPITLSSTSSNMTSHSINVKKLTGERLFVFSETYDPNWSLNVKSKKSGASYTIPARDHIIANGYANAWRINVNDLPKELREKDGDYQLLLEYKPQKWFFVGSIISVVMVTVTMFGVFLIIKSKQKR